MSCKTRVGVRNDQVSLFLAALTGITVISALQLRNGDRFREESFLELVKKFYRRLSLLKLARSSAGAENPHQFKDEPR